MDLAILVGEMHMPPREALDFDADEFAFWLERFKDYNEWVNKNADKQS